MVNRKLPFGYCLRCGQVREEEREAEVVRLIFRRYGEGISYGQLVEELSDLGIPYAPNRPWNKNMVARILQDRRYLGTQEYPQLLSAELIQASQSAKPDVSGTAEHPEIKDIRILARCSQCHGPMRRVRKNYWHCPRCIASPSKIKDETLILCVEQLLHSLQEHPDAIAPAPKPETASETVRAAQENLDCELDRAEFDETAAKTQTIALASARFNVLSSGDYETMRLRHLLSSAEQVDGLDTTLLRQIVSAVLIHPSGAVSLKLKNGQISGKPEN